MLEPPFNVPFVSVIAPEDVCVNPEPRFKVPPDPFTYIPAQETFPLKVTEPFVLVKETKPVVENPDDVLDAFLEPTKLILADDNVTVPLVVKSPVKLNVPEPLKTNDPEVVKSPVPLCTNLPEDKVIEPLLITEPLTVSVLEPKTRVAPELTVKLAQE